MLMQGRWKVLLFGIAMQYVHGIFTQLAHRMHQPGEQLLHDVGFEVTPVREGVSLPCFVTGYVTCKPCSKGWSLLAAWGGSCQVI